MELVDAGGLAELAVSEALPSGASVAKSGGGAVWVPVSEGR